MPAKHSNLPYPTDDLDSIYIPVSYSREVSGASCATMSSAHTTASRHGALLSPPKIEKKKTKLGESVKKLMKLGKKKEEGPKREDIPLFGVSEPEPREYRKVSQQPSPPASPPRSDVVVEIANKAVSSEDYDRFIGKRRRRKGGSVPSSPKQRMPSQFEEAIPPVFDSPVREQMYEQMVYSAQVEQIPHTEEPSLVLDSVISLASQLPVLSVVFSSIDKITENSAMTSTNKNYVKLVLAVLFFYELNIIYTAFQEFLKRIFLL